MCIKAIFGMCIALALVAFAATAPPVFASGGAWATPSFDLYNTTQDFVGAADIPSARLSSVRNASTSRIRSTGSAPATLTNTGIFLACTSTKGGEVFGSFYEPATPSHC